MSLWEQASSLVETVEPITAKGKVTDITGLVIEGNGPPEGIGATCAILHGGAKVPVEAVGFRKGKMLFMPLGEMSGIAPGATIIAQKSSGTVLASDKMLGRVFDPLCNPMDDGPAILSGIEMPLYREAPSAMTRPRIKDRFDVGVKVVNGLLTIGKGQRIGIMAGSGVGKSTFLGMIAKHAQNDINIIVLVGERGRELREFIERDLGPEGMERSVAIVATSDTSSLMRLRATFTGTAIAEYFRDRGKHVTLMVDSLTRLCMAQREIGLAIGEPPTAGGYTPSVFALLPKVLERAGTDKSGGTITGIYTVLVQGSDMEEPIADAVRGIVDGHIVMSRDLGAKGHYPAIDVTQSVSRCMSDIVSREEVLRAQKAKGVVSDYASVEDMISIGAYKKGQNERLDYAVDHIDAVNDFLKQNPWDKFSYEESLSSLLEALGET